MKYLDFAISRKKRFVLNNVVICDVAKKLGVVNKAAITNQRVLYLKIYV